MSARSTPHGELKRALKLAEARLASGGRLTGAELDELTALAEGALPAALSRRLAHVVATNALRTRSTPGDVLESFYEDVHAATQDERFTRARVSNAFLDAPRSIVVWRRTAAAACVLAAVAVGWAMTSDPEMTVRPPSQVERYSLLDGVLERFDPNGGDPASDGRAVDVHEVGGPYRGGASVEPRLWNRMRRGNPMLFFGQPKNKGRGMSGFELQIRFGGAAPDNAQPEVEKN